MWDFCLSVHVCLPVWGKLSESFQENEHLAVKYCVFNIHANHPNTLPVVIYMPLPFSSKPAQAFAFASRGGNFAGIVAVAMFCPVKSSPDKSAIKINLRLEVLIQENVVSVELKAVFVVYDDLLDTLEAAHKYIIDFFEQHPDPRSAVLGSEVSSEMLHSPLAYLWRTKRRQEEQRGD